MSLMKNAFVGAVVLISALVGSGCASQAAKTLGSLPVLMTRSGINNPKNLPAEAELSFPGDCGKPVLSVYCVNMSGDIIAASSTDNGVYRIADVTPLTRDFFLGVSPGTPLKLENLPSALKPPESTGASTVATDKAATKRSDSASELMLDKDVEGTLLARRAVIAMKLMEVADLNGAEYWRRFSGLIEYQKAFRAGEKALLGAGIASTFISPVLGASLTGAGLTTDAVTSSLTAGFDIETYTALRDAVRAEVVARKAAIRERLVTRCYLDYPISAVLADVSDYAHVYSIRGAVDTMKAALAEQARTAEERAKKKPAEPAPVQPAPSPQPAPTPPPAPPPQPAPTAPSNPVPSTSAGTPAVQPTQPAAPPTGSGSNPVQPSGQ